MTAKTCTIPDCERRHMARGLCNLHYQRTRQNGHVDFADPRTRVQRTADRIEDMSDLVSAGVSHREAALRAGWPTIMAAEITLRRRGRLDLSRPLRQQIDRERVAA